MGDALLKNAIHSKAGLPVFRIQPMQQPSGIVSLLFQGRLRVFRIISEYPFAFAKPVYELTFKAGVFNFHSLNIAKGSQ